MKQPSLLAALFWSVGTALLLAVLLTLLVLVWTAQAASVQLTWDYVQNVLAPASFFAVYRDTSCTGTFTVLEQIPVTQQTYTDTDDPLSPLVPGTSYCYFVTARDAAGRESGPSNTITFQVPQSVPAPAAPTGLRGVSN